MGKETEDERTGVPAECGAETEPPFSGKYYRHFEPGEYLCADCGAPLFNSETKYDSGSGWPSFYAPREAGAVRFRADHSFGMERTEVLCGRCGAHLGHVFPDGPRPTGMRYCINSKDLSFRGREESDPGV